MKITKPKTFVMSLAVVLTMTFTSGVVCGRITSNSETECEIIEKTVYTTDKTTVNEVIQETDKRIKNEPILESLGMFEATAYCPCAECCGKSDGITATGTKAKAGRTIAVDPKVIPYSSKVIINGNEYIAEDCGGSINGNRVDVYCDTHTEALNFGRKKVEVFIEREGENDKL